MKESSTNSNTAATTHLIGTIFGEESLATINIQMSNKAVCNEIMKTSFSSAFITPLNNIFVPFSTENDNYPSLIKDDLLEDENRIRNDTIDYEKIDGLDFSTVANKYSYHRPFGIDYEIIPTIGEGRKVDSDGNIENQGMSDYDLTSRNYSYDDEMRTVGFKLPFYFAGWGLDTAGRPVPSIYDEQKKNEESNKSYDDDGNLFYDNVFVDDYKDRYPDRLSGEISYLQHSKESGDIFQLELKKNTYIDGYNNNPSEWMAGPLDVRWDRYRGVWAASPLIVEGYLLGPLRNPDGRASDKKYTSGQLVVYTGKHEEWNAVQPMQTIWVINRQIGLSADAGTYVAAQWFPNGEFRPIIVDCYADPSGAVNRGKMLNIPEDDDSTNDVYDGGGIVR